MRSRKLRLLLLLIPILLAVAALAVFLSEKEDSKVTVVFLDDGCPLSSEQYSSQQEQVVICDREKITGGHAALVFQAVSKRANLEIEGKRLVFLMVTDDKGFASPERLATGIQTALVDYDADVINISYSMEKESSVLEDAVGLAAQKDVPVVVSLPNVEFSDSSYPADYNGAIGVGLSETNTSSKQRVLVPSQCVGKVSHLPVSTSVAAPLVAMLYGQYGSITIEEMKQILGDFCR